MRDRQNRTDPVSPPSKTWAGFVFVPAPLLLVGVRKGSAGNTVANEPGATGAAADDDATDLVVIGSHGRGSFRSLLLGSATARAGAVRDPGAGAPRAGE